VCASSAHQLADPDHLAQQEPQDSLDLPVNPEAMANQVSPDTLVQHAKRQHKDANVAQPVPPDNPEHLDLKDKLEDQDSPDNPDTEAAKDHLDLPDQPDNLDSLDNPEDVDSPETPEPQEFNTHTLPDQREPQAPLDSPDNPETLVNPVSPDTLAHKDHLEHPVSPDSQEDPDNLEPQASPDPVDEMPLTVLAHTVPQLWFTNPKPKCDYLTDEENHPQSHTKHIDYIIYTICYYFAYLLIASKKKCTQLKNK
jgi:hypothetical protein